MSEPTPLYPVSRIHLDRLTDAIGIREHAIGSEPDPTHGYCTDDVARALEVDLLHARTLGWPAVAGSAWRSLRFLGEAFDDLTGRFRNVRRSDGSWVPGPASDDSQGRAMLGLSAAIATAPDGRMVAAATSLFLEALPQVQRVGAIRARASVILACDAVHRANPSRETAAAHRLLATDLMRTFRGAAEEDPAWPWPDGRLTYENTRPARALIVAGRSLGSTAMLDLGISILDWLIATQTADDGHFSPIGNGWWTRGEPKATFDQQPIEATSMLLGAEAALAATGDRRYADAMERAYAWFLGANDLGLAVADPIRGASYDGLTPTGVNTNQGAESTLMWLTALEHMREARREPAVDAVAEPAIDTEADATVDAAQPLVGASR
jgi:hypothetical protein